MGLKICIHYQNVIEICGTEFENLFITSLLMVLKQKPTRVQCKLNQHFLEAQQHICFVWDLRKYFQQSWTKFFSYGKLPPNLGMWWYLMYTISRGEKPLNYKTKNYYIFPRKSVLKLILIISTIVNTLVNSGY